MMKQFVIQKNAIGISREEMQKSIPMSVMVPDRGENMICPKPRRLSLLNTLNDHPVKSLKWQLIHQGEFCDSKPGINVLDIILTKDGCAVEECHTQAASPPPFFCGSPPSGVGNPLIQDARFGDEKVITPLPSPSPPSGSRKGSCVRASFGNKPTVRVEGFDCLNRDSRNCSIPSLA